MALATDAGNFLADLRNTHQTAEALPEGSRPLDTASAYAIQDALVERLMAPHGGKCIGYKVACTNTYAQKMLGVDAPFYGQLLSSATYDAPAKLPVSGFLHRLIEPEFAFEMAHDVPWQDVPYTASSITPYVSTLIPAIEIVDWHYRDWSGVGAPSLIADNAIHGAWISGPAVASWQHLDLATHGVQLLVNGQVRSQAPGQMSWDTRCMCWLGSRMSCPTRDGNFELATELQLAFVPKCMMHKLGIQCGLISGPLERLRFALNNPNQIGCDSLHQLE